MRGRRRRTLRARHSVRRFRRRHRLAVRRSLLIGSAGLALLFVGCLTHGDFGKANIHETADGTAAVDRQVRVRLLGVQPVQGFSLEVASSYRVQDGATGKTLSEASAPLPVTRVSAARQHDGIMLGAVRCASDDIVIEPRRAASVVVDGKTYRGVLRIRRVGNGVTVTNIVDLEDYLCGVLRGELPASFHPQAQRALAVAARTYVTYERLTTPKRQDYDVLADERSQMYLGVKGEDAAAVQAVQDTTGQVCLVRDDGKDKVFCAYYSSCCGGQTQPVTEFRPSDPDVPTLAGGVRCGYCENTPAYKWGPVRISKAELTKRVVARFPKLSRIGQITQVVAEERGSGGRVTKVKLVGSGGASESLVGEDFRLCVGGHTLRSTYFKIVDEKGYVKFVDGRGFGHGVGLCQYGADRMAKTGKGYREILQFYYPGCILREIY